MGKEAALLLSKGSGRDRVKCWHPRGTGDLSWVTAGRCDVSKVKSHGGAGRAGEKEDAGGRGCVGRPL